MSWTRKLFTSGGANTSVETSFPTNTTTVWNLNTTRPTNILTSRSTTTVWQIPGNTTTIFLTSRTTSGNTSFSTLTTFPTSTTF
jgi:hypothetical protein